jgi:hypothetical protein
MDAFPDERWASYKYVSLLAGQQTVLLALEEADGALAKHSDFGEMALLAGSIATEAGFLDRASRYFMRAWEQGLADGLVGLQNLVALYSEKGEMTSASELTAQIGTKRGAQ